MRQSSALPTPQLNSQFAPAAEQPTTWWADALRRFWVQRLALAAALLLIAMMVLALLAPWVAPYDPIEQFRDIGLSTLGEPVSPNATFWLGTDGLGRDLTSRMLHGARISLGIAITANSISILLALLIGGIAGFAGGKTDFFLMRFVDLVISMPTFFISLLLVVMLRPGIWVVILVVSLFSWTAPARVFRSQILHVKQLDFIPAARSVGMAEHRIFVRHLLPHLLPMVIIYLALGIPNTIFAEAALSFLGLGVPPPAPSWGAMIQNGMDYYRAAPWIAFFPGLAIMVTVVCFNQVARGLREAMDPTRRGRS